MPLANPSRYSTVMLVDDDAIERFLVSALMEKTCFAENLLCFSCPTEAINYLSMHASDHTDLPILIFLDINMPGLNGFGFLDIYSKMEFSPGTRPDVVMLSSSINEEELQRSASYSCVKKILCKPLTEEQLGFL